VDALDEGEEDTVDTEVTADEAHAIVAEARALAPVPDRHRVLVLALDRDPARDPDLDPGRDLQSSAQDEALLEAGMLLITSVKRPSDTKLQV